MIEVNLCPLILFASVARSQNCFPASTSKKFGQFWKKFGQVHKNLNAAFS